ncbi:peptidase of plants and bacteria-domain-containing protein [Daldinia sp. FL1419]|nr:peptidase of plants and bacteria-domain-containing protein [Daldinia sp. FL1419]
MDLSNPVYPLAPFPAQIMLTPDDLPEINLQVFNTSHPGYERFQEFIDVEAFVEDHIFFIHSQLYDHPQFAYPAPRFIEIRLIETGGGKAVAYTVPSHEDYRQIYFSLEHLEWLPRARIELILRHELVHCYQWGLHSSARRGLIEGIADWVCMQRGSVDPDWQGRIPERWDAGYADTAYFLAYLENRFGKGTVRRINRKLHWMWDQKDEERFWFELLGADIEELFEDYKATFRASDNYHWKAAARYDTYDALLEGSENMTFCVPEGSQPLE